MIGHAINMFMNVLGAMVHPMRLTFVEFLRIQDTKVEERNISLSKTYKIK